MTAAYRLKGLGWFGGCVVVALGFYLVSLGVAAERKKLESAESRIRVAQRDIRALETEFDTRANLAQLERWNGGTLALVAPGANQFVRNEAQLAAVRFGPGPLAGGEAPVRTAALVVPAFDAAATTATVVEPAQPVSAPVTVRVAAASVPAAAPVARAIPGVAVVAAKPAPVRRQQVAMLLSDATMGDLVRSARGEAGRLR